ncbi:MAG: hypothetical protein V4617_15025 [Gemmatimonadota bacterium]
MPDGLTATCYFRVLLPLYFPVMASPGEILAVWPLPENLWVFDAHGDWVIRRRSFPEGKLWSTLEQLLVDEIIQYLDGAELSRLQQPLRPLPVADVPSRPALRVIRGR